MAEEKKETEFDKFVQNQETILQKPEGNGQMFTNANFTSTIYSAEASKKLDAVPDDSGTILTNTPTEVQTQKENIQTVAMNNFFKMFYDLYMANEESDMVFRLGKKCQTVTSEKRIQTSTNFKMKFSIDSNFYRARQPDQYLINYFFPPYNSLIIEDNASKQGDSIYRVWNESYGRWDYVDSKEKSYKSFDSEKLLLSSENFTYRGNSFKAVNDNINILQRMLEHVTGIVSTYLTEWDISLYMQEGIFNSDSQGIPNIGLLYRILQDNPSKYNDYRAFTWGALNAGVSKLSACSGLVNAPEYHFNPKHFPYSKHWSQYDSIDRGDGLDIAYDIARSDGTINPSTYTRISIDKVQGLDVLNKKYDDYNFKEKIYFWDCKGAAYSGWKNWRDIRYFNTVYTTPDDGLSSIDIVHESESKANLKWADTGTEKGVINRVIQALYNDDPSLGFAIQEWKIKRVLNPSADLKKDAKTGSYRYDYYVKNPITGSPAFVAAALYNCNDKIIDWYDEQGNVLNEITNAGVLKKFGIWAPLLKSKLTLRFYLSKTCKYWPEVGEQYSTVCPCENDTTDNFSEAPQSTVMAEKSEPSSPASTDAIMSATEEKLNGVICNSGVPRWNPFLYRGPHGRNTSPYVVSSMFDENSKSSRNIPRIEPGRTDKRENIGVEKFYNYTTPDMLNPIEFPDYGNTRSPSSALELLKNGYLNAEYKKDEIYATYREFLPWVEKSKIVKCKTQYYWAPKYESLGNNRNKTGKDTVVYDSGDAVMGDVVEHTGYFSPNKEPTLSSYNADKIGNGTLWYDSAAYEWATYFKYASSGTKYYKGNVRRTKATYPKSTSSKSPKSLATKNTVFNVLNKVTFGLFSWIGKKVAKLTGTNYESWKDASYDGDFYELLCTYRSKGKYGTWHRWEVIYVKTPIMYADLTAPWHIDEFDDCKYTTSQTNKKKNMIIGICTLGIGNLFTSKNVKASVSDTDKKYRLIVGNRNSSQIKINDDSFIFATDEEKKIKDYLIGETNNWKKIYLFATDTYADSYNKGPKAIVGVYIRKAKYQYITVTESTNKVGCKSSKNKVEKVNETEYIEVYYEKSSDKDYKKYRPEIMTAFNPKYFDGGEVFNPTTFSLEKIEEMEPGQKNICPFINNIFDIHQPAGVATNNVKQLLRLLSEDEMTSTDPDEQAGLEGKKFIYSEYKEPENESTYGWGFTTYFPAIYPGDVPQNFRKRVDLRYKATLGRPNQRDFVYKWWPEELKKIKMYDFQKTYKTTVNNVVEKHNTYKSKADGHIEDVIVGSAEEKAIKAELRWPDANVRKQMGIDEGNRYYANWPEDALDAPISWFFEFGDETGAYDKNVFITDHPSYFTPGYDFWCANDFYGNSFTRAKGYYAQGKAIQQALLGYFTTSTFFRENTQTTSGDEGYGDVTSPCIVSNTVPFFALYASICTHYTWAQKAKEYLCAAIGKTDKNGKAFQDMMRQIIDTRILQAVGLEPIGYKDKDKKEAIYEEDKNSLFYNPWIKLAYNNADDLSKMETAFTDLISVLKICKSNLEFMDLDSGYSNFSINQIEKFYNKAKEVQEQINKLENNQINTLFNYIYSYLNVLYEYRKYFIFKRCNKQNGTLYAVRNFESTLPLVENNMTSNDIPDYATDKTEDNSHIYQVAMRGSQNTNSDRTMAFMDKSKRLPDDRIQTIYIPVEYVDKDNQKLQEYIKYYNEHNGEIPADMQRYVYIPKTDKWAKVPFNDTYALHSEEFLEAEYKISKNNKIKEFNDKQENESTKEPYIQVDEAYYKRSATGSIYEPYQIDRFTQNINWIDTSKVDKMYNLIQSVEINENNKSQYDYNVPYYEFDPGAEEYPFIYFGKSEGVNIDKLIEFETDPQSTVLDEFCAARATMDFWRVILKGNIPLWRLHQNNLKIVPYYEGSGDDSYQAVSYSLEGPFSNLLWPIYKDQNAPIPSPFDTSMFGL